MLECDGTTDTIYNTTNRVYVVDNVSVTGDLKAVNNCNHTETKNLDV